MARTAPSRDYTAFYTARPIRQAHNKTACRHLGLHPHRTCNTAPRGTLNAVRCLHNAPTASAIIRLLIPLRALNSARSTVNSSLNALRRERTLAKILGDASPPPPSPSPSLSPLNTLSDVTWSCCLLTGTGRNYTTPTPNSRLWNKLTLIPPHPTLSSENKL